MAKRECAWCVCVCVCGVLVRVCVRACVQKHRYRCVSMFTCVSILDSRFLHYNIVFSASPYLRVAIYYCAIVKDPSQLRNNSKVKVGVDARD